MGAWGLIDLPYPIAVDLEITPPTYACQRDPHPVVAHRTSPTNVGLYLLSTVAAHDFGWIGTVEVAKTRTNFDPTSAVVQGL